MATEKILNTRIGLKIDTLENWSKSTLALKPGEVAFATVAATAGTGLTEPVVMMKIGEDGVKTFNDIEYNFYAKASDVLAACKSEEGLKAFVNGVIADAGIASNDAMEALAGRVTDTETAITTLNGDAETAGSVAKAIKDAIDALDLANTYVAKEGYVAYTQDEKDKLAGVSTGANKVEASETNGNIKIDGVETVVYTHPEKHTIDDVTGLQDALDGKQAAGDYAAEVHTHTKEDITDFAHTHVAADITDLDDTIKAYDYATKTEAQGYADAKDEAIAAAKKAGDDAQDAIDAYIESNNTALAGVKTTAEQGVADAAKVAGDLATHISDADGKFETKDDASAKLTEAKGYTDTEIERVQTQINTIMNNPDTEGVINSINEFTQYITEHGEIAEGFRTDIDKNKEDIAANAGRLDAVEAEMAEHTHSWNDLTDKPFGEEGIPPITWDGNIEGKDNFEWQNITYCRVTDEFIPSEQVIGATVTFVTPEGQTTDMVIQEVEPMDEGSATWALVLDGMPFIIGAHRDELNEMFTAEGLYLPNQYGIYVSSITFAGGSIKTLDDKYISSNIARTDSVTALDERVQVLEAIDHDAYVAADTELKNELQGKIDAIDNHSHENKTVLDGITSDKVTAWDAAEQNTKDYADGKVTDLANGQVKTNTDAIDAINNEETGILAQAKTDAANNDVVVLAEAQKYADGLAGNYATAAQGAKADSALQEVVANDTYKVDDNGEPTTEIEKHSGLKVTDNNKIEIDDTIVWVFDCGSSAV